MKVNIGDKVKVKTWEEMASKFYVDCEGDIDMGIEFFTEDMRECCGEVYEVYGTNTRKTKFYLRENLGDEFYNLNFNFIDDMVDVIE